MEIRVSNGVLLVAFCNTRNDRPHHVFQIRIDILVSNGNKNIGFKREYVVVNILLDNRLIDIFIYVCKDGISNSCN